MNCKRFVATAVIAAALPCTALASGSATLLGGPQGTGFYGFVDPLDPERRGIVEQSQVGPVLLAEYTQLNDSKLRRGAYAGPSWATNPPAPPQ